MSNFLENNTQFVSATEDKSIEDQHVLHSQVSEELSEDDLEEIAGGWVAAAAGVVAAGATVYMAFTTEEERIGHRRAIQRGATEAGRGGYRLGKAAASGFS
jgi:hypothetical protein